MTSEEDLAFHCAPFFLTNTIKEYGRLKMAGESIPSIDKQLSGLAQKRQSSSSSFQDGVTQYPHFKTKTNPKKAVRQISLYQLCCLSESFKLSNLGHKLYGTLGFW